MRIRFIIRHVGIVGKGFVMRVLVALKSFLVTIPPWRMMNLILIKLSPSVAHPSTSLRLHSKIIIGQSRGRTQIQDQQRIVNVSSRRNAIPEYYM
jgi:hypothetical protein